MVKISIDTISDPIIMDGQPDNFSSSSSSSHNNSQVFDNEINSDECKQPVPITVPLSSVPVSAGKISLRTHHKFNSKIQMCFRHYQWPNSVNRIRVEREMNVDATEQGYLHLAPRQGPFRPEFITIPP